MRLKIRGLFKAFARFHLSIVSLSEIEKKQKNRHWNGSMISCSSV